MIVGDPCMVAIQDRAVELVTAGDAEPLIVLESGLGDDWSSWSPVLDELAARSSVLAYSRPGYGRSAAVDTPRDIRTEAHELHQLLTDLGRQPPFVLVGHSLGGLIVQACAASYPEDVAGLVLVDAPHPCQIEYRNRDTSAAGEEYRRFARALTGAARAEHEALTSPGGGHFQGDRALHAGPVLFLCAWLRDSSVPEAYQRYRRTLALEAAAAYPNAELRRIFCDHYIHRERPHALIDAVEEILARVRQSAGAS